MSVAPPVLADVTGVIHCHSTYSDGMEDIPYICRAGRRAGIDYLLMTDHDTLAPIGEVGEGYRDGVLLLLGVEITPRHNHYLAYGVSDLPGNDLPPQEYIARVAAQGGFGFCAHPFEDGSAVLRQDEYSWLDWEASGFTGLEVWNYFSSWVTGCTSVPRALTGVVHWPLVARGPDTRTLRRWDDLGRHRAVVGIGGVDAHGIKARLGAVSLRLHPYRRSFRTVRTHLLPAAPLTGDLAADRQAICYALRRGRCYIANWELGDPRPFRFGAVAGDRWLEMGEEIPAQPVQFCARLGRGADLVLLRDGRPVAAGRGATLIAGADAPGVYRLEARRRGRVWVLSNPIYLR